MSGLGAAKRETKQSKVNSIDASQLNKMTVSQVNERENCVSVLFVYCHLRVSEGLKFDMPCQF